ncbi:MAG TPA: hypothetical protein PLT31_04535 [Fibrobacteraceae bacterium]|jgi:tetratricopeptide (TPR) repeat protein|nr:hypothetical protein [Fibrobacter sp.]HPW94439.1 hypothetical protein [Fibrobacteraceae bacterium]
MVFRALTILLLWVWGIGVANEDLRIGDSCYSLRAEKANGDKADTNNVKKMIQAYERAFAAADTLIQEKAAEGLLKSYYFMLRFASPEKDKRKDVLNEVTLLSEKIHSLYPNNRNITKIYIVILSMWGAETNPLIAVKQGVAKKVRDLADSIQDYQILGRSHQILPYIPIILSWPDKKLAEKYLKMSLEQDSKDPYNYFFLSELRFDQGLYDEAEKIIQAGLDLGVRTDFFLEDKRGRWHLKELQKKVRNKKRR